MRLLVVGATGGLGRLAVAEAVSRGHEVTALVRDRARAGLPEQVVTVRGDVLDPASLAPAVDGQEAVVCALGTPSPRQASSLLENLTRNLVETMKSASVPRLACGNWRRWSTTLTALAGSRMPVSQSGEGPRR